MKRMNLSISKFGYFPEHVNVPKIVKLFEQFDFRKVVFLKDDLKNVAMREIGEVKGLGIRWEFFLNGNVFTIHQPEPDEHLFLTNKNQIWIHTWQVIEELLDEMPGNHPLHTLREEARSKTKKQEIEVLFEWFLFQHVEYEIKKRIQTCFRIEGVRMNIPTEEEVSFKTKIANDKNEWEVYSTFYCLEEEAPSYSMMYKSVNGNLKRFRPELQLQWREQAAFQDMGFIFRHPAKTKKIQMIFESAFREILIDHIAGLKQTKLQLLFSELNVRDLFIKK